VFAAEPALTHVTAPDTAVVAEMPVLQVRPVPMELVSRSATPGKPIVRGVVPISRPVFSIVGPVEKPVAPVSAATMVLVRSFVPVVRLSVPVVV
jgi:hypothetical protein